MVKYYLNSDDKIKKTERIKVEINVKRKLYKMNRFKKSLNKIIYLFYIIENKLHNQNTKRMKLNSAKASLFLASFVFILFSVFFPNPLQFSIISIIVILSMSMGGLLFCVIKLFGPKQA